MKKTHLCLRRLCCLLLAILLPGIAGAEWICFDNGAPPDNTGYLVNEYTGNIVITFLGDCTLGGETASAGNYNGYVRTITRNGYAYPFRNLLTLTGSDDITIANLEGVLSDRELTKVEKEFNFIGPASFASILTEGSIDCVTLANNHSHDFGKDGYLDTKSALQAEGTAFFGSDCLAIWDRDGLMIGFVGVTSSSTSSFAKRIQLLWGMGCCAVIAYMHSGREGSGTIISQQRSIAKTAAANGCSLLVGSHPHVVQGYEEVDGMPVLYSLGNCSFGGNHNPSDKHALVLQAELLFEDGTPTGIDLHLYPISVSGSTERNDFSPILLKGKAAERVLAKMEASTGWELPDFEEGVGALIHCGR